MVLSLSVSVQVENITRCEDKTECFSGEMAGRPVLPAGLDLLYKDLCIAAIVIERQFAHFLVPTLQRGNAYLAIISTNGWPTGITRLGTLDLF
jgi:hypothetical protein